MRRTLRRSGWLLVKRGDREQVLSCGSHTRSLGLRLVAQPTPCIQMTEKSGTPIRSSNMDIVDQDALGGTEMLLTGMAVPSVLRTTEP